MGCLPRAGPTPRLLILMASCCALCSGWVTAYRLRCLVIAELRYSSADLYPRALRHATRPGRFRTQLPDIVRYGDQASPLQLP